MNYEDSNRRPTFRAWLPSWFLMLIVTTCLTSSQLVGQEAATPAKNPLAQRQEQIAERYKRLEELLLRMAQLEGQANPRRAALLQQAAELSQQKHTRSQLKTIAEMLGNKQYSKAVKEQTSAEVSLEDLLKLLQSEDRSAELKSEQERLKEYMKEVERLIRLQRSLEGQNTDAVDPKKLAQEQDRLAQRANELAEKIRSQEETKDGKTDNESSPSKSTPDKPSGEEPPKSDDKKPSESKPSDSKPAEAKPSESKPSESKPMESKPSDAKPADASPPPMASESESPPSESPPEGESSPMSDAKPNPVRERVDQAKAKMKAAAKKLEDSKRKESRADQEIARQELEKAKAELEKILKQLREEEKERALASLESRFRKMMEMQARVLDSTKKLADMPAAQRSREFDVHAGKLAGEEAKIVLEGEKALQLLAEEGSSVAFPATLEQLLDDMRTVMERLHAAKADSLTVGLEEEIIGTLEELLKALQQAQQDLEEQKQKPPGEAGPSGQPGEQPLVDAIEELKMIKSLQLRVNSRTDRYAKLLQDPTDPVGQANTQELTDALDKLGDKQREVFAIVRKILLKQ